MEIYYAIDYAELAHANAVTFASNTAWPLSPPSQTYSYHRAFGSTKFAIPSRDLLGTYPIAMQFLVTLIANLKSVCYRINDSVRARDSRARHLPECICNQSGKMTQFIHLTLF